MRCCHYRVSQKMSQLTKYDTIAPNPEINDIRFQDIDPDVHADSRYKNSSDQSRNVRAPENEGRVLLKHKVCISVACEICCLI